MVASRSHFSSSSYNLKKECDVFALIRSRREKSIGEGKIKSLSSREESLVARSNML